MKQYETVIGEAKRIEIEQNTGKLYLVFEITNEKVRQQIKDNWTADIEFEIIDRKLIARKEKEI